MDHKNIGFVNLNDQYRLNTSKSKRMGNNFGNAANSQLRSSTGKQRSSSQGDNDAKV